MCFTRLHYADFLPMNELFALNLGLTRLLKIDSVFFFLHCKHVFSDVLEKYKACKNLTVLKSHKVSTETYGIQRSPGQSCSLLDYRKLCIKVGFVQWFT